MIFSEQDIRQLESIGKTLLEAEQEMLLCAAGIPPINLKRRCSYDDGIIGLSREQEIESAESFNMAMASGRALKFVAASGAASRMFHSPISCMQRGWVSADLLNEKARQGDGNAEECIELFRNLPKFAFFHVLKDLMASKDLRLERLIERGEYEAILEHLLTSQGLGYGALPKGLIPFHVYPDGTRTAFEEHLIESVGYLKDRNNVAGIHFTVAQEYMARIQEHLLSAASKSPTKGARFDITFSVQRPGTDTVVLDCDGHPLRDEKGRLVLLPSGHGALLENLSALRGDIVFIRTIDNVLPDRLKDMVCFHKRVLGGYLIQLQEELFGWLRLLSSAEVSEPEMERIREFAEIRLNLRSPAGLDCIPLKERARVWFRRLNAPLRVCGMVRDPGYPGGRPFWVQDEAGWESLQIIEAAQVDRRNAAQDQIWNSCEFFNPADIVCGVRDYAGQPFDLAEFSDPGLGFVSEKTYRGRKCRILERPGLWNGSMARWNTVFIEVPALTLRPVKTILDLLGEESHS